MGALLAGYFSSAGAKVILSSRDAAKLKQARPQRMKCGLFIKCHTCMVQCQNLAV
jgi:hypothetical protein